MLQNKPEALLGTVRNKCRDVCLSQAGGLGAVFPRPKLKGVVNLERDGGTALGKYNCFSFVDI